MPEGGFPVEGVCGMSDPLCPPGRGPLRSLTQGHLSDREEPGWEGGWRWSVFISTGLCFRHSSKCEMESDCCSFQGLLHPSWKISIKERVNTMDQRHCENFLSFARVRGGKESGMSFDAKSDNKSFICFRNVRTTWNGHSFTQSPSFLL